ncbi:MAG: hypothetical protein QOH39_407 [Verrucomicrobiota bacterium]|jgi:hypothetical protein
MALPDLDIVEFNGNGRNLARALDHAGPVDVLLHYAGRAYHAYGSPVWLPAVLSRWKQKCPAGRLTVLFHEIPPKLPFSSRHYWMNLGNERVIRKLARLADALITNTSEHVAKLERISGRRDVHRVPVGSNIEPSEFSVQQRKRTEFVVFGLPFGRWQTLEMFNREIPSWQKNGHLARLHLIGPRDAKFDRRSDRLIETYPNPASVVIQGEMPPAEISRLLASAQFALSNAGPENWSKSSTFMAYAAHGCAIVSEWKSESVPLSFAVRPGEVTTVSDGELRERTESLHEWYDKNAAWDVIARRISEIASDQSALTPTD